MHLPVLHGLWPKMMNPVRRCHQLLFVVLAKDHLSRVSHQSLLSANGKVDNEMISGTVHRSPSSFLISKENPGKPQLGDRFCKLSSLHMRSVGSHNTPGMKKEEKKEKMGLEYIVYLST